MTENQSVVSTLQILLMFSAIGLAPYILVMLTGFTRIIISLQFLRSALGTQQMPPNQILVGLALFLTLFIMGPIFDDINANAIKPFSAGTLSADEAIDRGMEPLRVFMRNQAEDKDVALFVQLSGQTVNSVEEIPDRVLIPAFMLGELTKGFKVGFIIYLPFIVIDMVVASILMAMGMMMLPPVMISLPFKILIFIMSGGWSYMLESLVRTFRM
ncbi:MAG: flagellar type III secretion system pore protein FliP [Clostridiales bacterium]|jgi:flagellar biosynthetic protein FliP|nr:flagellar type III secretion system pore protein FliP [Clostridiales bacterium]